MRNKSLFLLFIVFCHTQSWYNHSELVWKTYETKHFIIHFHNGVERTADEAAYIAEAIYHPITEFYNFTPQGKTTIVLRDSDDFSNGTAFYYDNKIDGLYGEKTKASIKKYLFDHGGKQLFHVMKDKADNIFE